METSVYFIVTEIDSHSVELSPEMQPTSVPETSPGKSLLVEPNALNQTPHTQNTQHTHTYPPYKEADLTQHQILEIRMLSLHIEQSQVCFLLLVFKEQVCFW